jgi:hypothetical protein
MSKIGGSDSKKSLYCSFCGKSQNEVRKLIAGLLGDNVPYKVRRIRRK